MSLDSTWKPAHDVTLVIAGVTYPCIDCEYAETVEDFETTNTESNGDFECGVNVHKRMVRGNCPVDSADVKIPPIKSLVAASWSDGVETYSGKIRLLERTKKGGGKGGYNVAFSGPFTGVVTTT